MWKKYAYEKVNVLNGLDTVLSFMFDINLIQTFAIDNVFRCLNL